MISSNLVRVVRECAREFVSRPSILFATFPLLVHVLAQPLTQISKQGRSLDMRGSPLC